MVFGGCGATPLVFLVFVVIFDWFRLSEDGGSPVSLGQHLQYAKFTLVAESGIPENANVVPVRSFKE